jgi:hypothetical protein
MNRYATHCASVLIAGALGCRQTHATELRATWERGGVVRLTDEKKVARIDVSRDIDGCLGDLFDPVTKERLGVGESGRILDVAEVDQARFILAAAAAPPNCNVQGHCGAAGPNVTLIWLRVGRDMSLVAKQAFPVVDCIDMRSVEDFDDDWPKRLKVTDGTLTIKFTELTLRSDINKLAESSGSLTYDRKNASAGIQISRTAVP